jgi:FixJ family two-component response regulator
MAVRSTSERARNNRLVLVVDDDARVRESLADLLGSAGIDTLCFASAEELFSSDALLRASCLVTDVRMPGMDGWELFHRVSETHPQILVILTSAFQEPSAQARAHFVGAFAFLFKPFDGEELLRTVEAALLHAAILARLFGLQGD